MRQKNSISATFFKLKRSW